MIHILPPELANRIAAGEVVERPASVVRELIDNAIDAGATRIDVEVEHGGTGMIRVTDNGSGMSQTDAQLCIKRHATSKIFDTKDLETISTKGFRGEALAAISSVSQFEIKTRQEGESLGSLIFVEGGKEHDPKEVGTSVGTSVTVRDLFYNVPARRKFLKKPTTEVSNILSTITWNALAHERVHFTFTKDCRRSLDYPGVSNRPERIKQIFGKDILDELIPAHYESPEVSITGFISRPTLTRNTAQQVFFFVNDRYIRDRLLHSAMMQGYRSLIPSGRYPIVFLFFEIDSKDIDINVHPTKQEIKFSNENTIFSATYRTIRKAWDVEDQKQEAPPQQPSPQPSPSGRGGGSNVPEGESPSPTGSGSDHHISSEEQPSLLKQSAEEQPLSLSSATGSGSESDTSEGEHPVLQTQPLEAQPSPQPSPSGRGGTSHAPTDVQAQKQPVEEQPSPMGRGSDSNTDNNPETKPSLNETIAFLNRAPLHSSNQEQTVQPPETNHKATDEITAQNGIQSRQDSAIQDLMQEEKVSDDLFQVKSLEHAETLKVLGQLKQSYILAESAEGLYIIDQHAAHERLKFEEFLLASKNNRIMSQPLLLPLTVDLGPDEVALLEDNLSLFEKFGFEIEPFGPQTFVIRAMPASLLMNDAEDFVKDLIGQIQHAGDAEERHERALHTMACRAAVKFGDVLTHDEMCAIIQGLELIPRRNVCPHGRPSILFVSDHNLRKLFKRLGF